ncbi:hypothetical protein VCHA53O466_50297 [Vibrio chagasii]|nr:hypothetical protein VCHA53O466_50297 [Vibrio chagasii]
MQASVLQAVIGDCCVFLEQHRVTVSSKEPSIYEMFELLGSVSELAIMTRRVSELKMLFVRLTQANLQLLHEGHFTLNDVSTDYESQSPLTVFVWCDEAYIVSVDDSSVVHFLDGSIATENFQYGLEGVPLYVIGRFTKSGLEELYNY